MDEIRLAVRKRYRILETHAMYEYQVTQYSALTGTWVMDEVRLAVQKEYCVIEIHEVYKYQVTQYIPETGEGGLFVKYSNTFLKLKAKASGYPGFGKVMA